MRFFEKVITDKKVASDVPAAESSTKSRPEVGCYLLFCELVSNNPNGLGEDWTEEGITDGTVVGALS